MVYHILKSYRLGKVDAFKVFEVFKDRRDCFFLDSSLSSATLGRFSFLGTEPFYILRTRDEDPFKKLRAALSLYKISPTKAKNAFPFLGGAVGYLAYDLGLQRESKIKTRAKRGPGIPDCIFGFYNTIVAVDHLKKLLYILALGFPETNPRLAKLLAQSNFRKIEALLSGINFKKDSTIGKCTEFPAQLNSNFSKQEYLYAVGKAKEYIRKGDIYQVNLSHQFQAKSPLSAIQIYRRLRRLSPSCFSAYFDAGDFQILSSSPERFLELRKGLVVTRPMKGTRPRGKNRVQDAFLKKELLNSAKDKAELMMIVDLERNDLGRVCSYDSIRAVQLRHLERYRTVFQTTANITGRLHRDKDRIDLLGACFPGGSITGCPKIRAMEIIEELEPSRRGIYTGSFGYLSFCGNMDFNILIRTMLKRGDTLYFGVGGGIVADSHPGKEYKETLVKAKAMREAICARI